MNKSTVRAEADLSRSLQVLIKQKTAAIAERAMRGQEQLDAEDSLTYHVRLVLDNDEVLYRLRCEIVRKHLAAQDDCPICGGSGEVRGGIAPDGRTLCTHCEGHGERQRYPHQLGDRLKEFCEELAGLDINENDLLSNLAREVLSTGLAWVDWTEIAASYIEDMSAEVEARG